jgi:DNA polymerase
MKISWAQLYNEITNCEKCKLCEGRTNVVPGEGDPHARLMFIGEGPGQEEDRLGRPFVGRSGELLTRMIQAIGMERTETYICNIVKCRPPNNRVPTPEEAEACRIHLRMQTYLVKPKVIVLLGSTAAKNILDPELRITRERGKWTVRKGVWIMPTYHPSALLRDPDKKREAWEDMKSLRSRLIQLGLYKDIYGE